MAQRTSIYDIAKLAGLSAGSVSKILNGKGSFSQKTRERVVAIAREQGYVANFAAKALREESTHSVGIITPDVSNEFFSSIVMAAEIALRESGYTSYICNTGNDGQVEEDCLRGLVQKQADGFLFVGGSRPVDRSSIGEGTPVVCVDRAGTGDECCVEVQNDIEGMMYEATDVLLARGCQSVVFLNVFHGASVSKDDAHYLGYARALEKAGIAPDDRLLINGPHERPSYVEAEEVLGSAFDAGLSFDGVLAIGDRIAVGAVNALLKRGVSVGREVRVMGMDNTLMTRLMSPTVSTIDRNAYVLAQDAAIALVAMISGEETTSGRIVVPHHVIERETTLGA